MKYGEEKPGKKTRRRFYTHMSSGRKPREEKNIFKRPSLRQFQIAGDRKFQVTSFLDFPFLVFLQKMSISTTLHHFLKNSNIAIHLQEEK